MPVVDTDKIVEQNLGLVAMVVNRFSSCGLDFDDLYQIGSIGLVKAARNYDSSKGFCFSTYAVCKITGEIKSYLRDNGSIKVSRSLKEKLYQIQKMQRMLSDKLGRAPSIGEIAESIEISREEVAECMAISVTPLSLEEEYESGGTLMEAVGESDEDARLSRIAVSEALGKLEREERQIIVLRFFCDLTQAETAAKVGLSQVTVSRQEKKILKKLAKIIS